MSLDPPVRSGLCDTLVLAGHNTPAVTHRRLAGSLSLQDFVLRHYLPFVQTYKRSWRSDQSLFRTHILPALGQHALRHVPRDAITSLLTRMRQNGYAAATIGRVIALLKYTFRLADKWHFIDAAACPVAEFRVPPDVLRNRFLNNDEASRLVRALRADPNRTAARTILLILLTGARRSEITHAQWNNLLVDRKCLLVPIAKSGRPRFIMLNAAALEILDRMDRLPDNPYIFPSPLTGRPSPSLHFPWRRIRRNAGLPDDVRLHDLRHSFASFLVSRGISLYVVQHLLGHLHIRTTQRYCHLTPELLKQGADAMGDIFANWTK